jgi:outer membrane protein OmpA-like peptidoglycan-associated protein
MSAIVRGLNLEVEGRGDASGNLAATKVRFGKDDLAVAQSIDSRVAPAEDRLTQAEQNAQRVSGQIDELMAVSNAARGGAKAAQDTADAAVQGVNATNQRISEVDNYVVQSNSTVNFKVNSAVLSPEGKTSLDQFAQSALRRIGVSYGYGEAQPVADNETREGREQNRRVELKLMISKGINQNVEVRKDTGTSNEE